MSWSWHIKLTVLLPSVVLSSTKLLIRVAVAIAPAIVTGGWAARGAIPSERE
jgi:hypothetical protein